MRLPLALVVLAAAPALADPSFIIKVSNRVTEVQPSATVEVWAAFDADLFAFAGALFDIATEPDGGGFRDPTIPFDDIGGFLSPGEVSPDGDAVTGILTGQLCSIDCPLGIDKSNPILVWSATWETTDFSPRTIGAATFTTKFDLFTDNQGSSSSFLDHLEEGFALIEVGCYADFTGDGELDLFDFLAFVNAFNAGQAEADCDGDQSLSLFDFLCFVNRFNAGC
jgi:hypothetical protein